MFIGGGGGAYIDRFNCEGPLSDAVRDLVAAPSPIDIARNGGLCGGVVRSIKFGGEGMEGIRIPNPSCVFPA